MAPNFQYTITGNPNGRTILLINGWPDTPYVWRNQIAALSSKFRCVSLIIPGYETENKNKNWPFFGYTFNEVAEAMLRTIKEDIMAGRASKGETKPFALIAHDWGCEMSYRVLSFEPNLVEKFVALDVGATLKANPLQLFIIVTYQWFLLSIYLCYPTVIGNILARFAAKALLADRPEGSTARMAYLYVAFWSELLFGRGLKKGASHPRFYKPPVPMLFFYGKHKPIQFWSPKWLEVINNTAGSKVVPVEAGHWLHTEEKSEPFVTKEIVQFLSE